MVCRKLSVLIIDYACLDDSVDEETAVVETIPGYGSVEAENVGSRFKGWTAVAQLIPGK